jgi:hypothetical protein
MAGDGNRIKQSAARNIPPWKIPPWDIPPWELPGGFRFDLLPHRGPLLRRLANAAFVCSVLAYYPCLPPCLVYCCFILGIEESWTKLLESWTKLFGMATILGLLGSVLGLTVGMLARGDLEAMRTGLIDPEGKWETKFGCDRAFNSFGLGLASFLLWSTPLLFAYWRRL